VIKAILSIISSVFSLLPRLYEDWQEAQAERERAKRDARNEQAIKDADK
jgi:hypothetical protein